MVVIELGPVGAGDALVSPRGPTLPRRVWRALAAAATAALVLATTLASGGPPLAPPRLGVPLWTANVGPDYWIADDGVYVRTLAGIVAYDGATGARRWALTGDNLYFIREDQGLAILIDGQDEAVHTIVVDAKTGAERLRYEAFPIGVSADRQVALLNRPSHACTGSEACTVLLGVDLGTGALAWQREISTFARWSADTAPGSGLIRRLLIDDRLGLAQLWDAGTGAVTASTSTPPPTDDRAVNVAALDDGFVVATGTASQVVVTRYAAGVANPVWTVPLGPNADMRQAFYVWTVSDMVVVIRGSLLTVLDVRTGFRRLDVAANGLLELGGGRYLAEQNIGERFLVATIVDAPTGDTHFTFTGSAVFAVGGHPDRVLLIREDEATAFIRLIDRTGRTWLQDVVTGPDINCRAGTRLLACADASKLMRVWSLPAP